MKEATPSNEIIIVLTEHPVLGVLLIPYMAEKSLDGEEIQLMEQAFHASAKVMKLMTDAERKAIDIAAHYTDKYLMEVYSHEKTTGRFLRKLSESPNEMKKNIRPFIEKKLLEMIDLILHHGLPLYQKQSGSNQLYQHHAYKINQQPVETSFTFEVDDTSFNYQLDCNYEGRALLLTERKPVVVLTSNPATLLMGMELFVFHHMEAMRLLPFTKKARVTVDAAFLQKYIDNIIIPIARYHDITTHGLELIEEKRLCQPLLYVEESICDNLVLRLLFQYGDQTFSPDHSAEKKKFIDREETDSERTIRYFCRDIADEERLVDLLIANDLEQINETLFKLTETASDKSITAWISNHREMLQKEFQLTSSTQEKPYCLDQIHVEQHYEDGPDWFDLHITVVIGNQRIPFSHFRKHILQENREYTLPDGSIVLLPEEWFSKYSNLFALSQEHETVFRLKQDYIGVVESLMQDNCQPEYSVYQPQQVLPTPAGLKATLRPYQQKGFGWMMHLNEHNYNGCLADDMGLGKTLQTLTLLQQIYGNNHAVPAENQAEEVLAPTGSLDEMGQFVLFDDLTETLAPITPQTDQAPVERKPSTLIVMPTSLLHNWRKEAKRFTTLSMAEYNSSTPFRKGHPELFFNRYRLIFTSYGMMRNNIGTLREYCFEYIILDESQNIKNSESLSFRSAIQLKSHHRLVLTGTPIENSLKDLWSQFHFLQPDLLGDEASFFKQFIAPIQQQNNSARIRLQQLISPFILRRNKREVAPELPPLTEEMIYCSMTDEQNTLYQLEKNSLRNALLQVGTQQKGHQALMALNGISYLRQLACHPAMVATDFKGNSGKLEQIIDTFETLRSEGHKVLIFSSFVKHLDLIAAAFKQRQWTYALLTGATNNRQEEIDRFSGSEEIQAFLISLKAGGVGLNLTQADYVFIIDPWWNPAAETQAIARAHRIGQDKQVIAYRFITHNSIEEKILLLQESKRELANTFINGSEDTPTLTDQEWAELLK